MTTTDERVAQIRKRFSSQLLCRCPELLEDRSPSPSWAAGRTPENSTEKTMTAADENAEISAFTVNAEQIGKLQARVAKLEGEVKAAREFTIEDIARWFDVSPDEVKYLESVEKEMKASRERWDDMLAEFVKATKIWAEKYLHDTLGAEDTPVDD